MGYRIDLTKPPKQILVDRFNYVFGISYTVDNYDFHPAGVQPLTKEERRKKGVESKVAARFKNGISGHREFYITRADLSKFLVGIEVEVPKGAVEWSHELAPYVIEQIGLDLEPYDIMVEPITDDMETYQAHLIPNHLSFKGTISIVFVDPTPRLLANLVTKRALDGFTYGVFL